jgi:hypothetical protein
MTFRQIAERLAAVDDGDLGAISRALRVLAAAGRIERLPCEVKGHRRPLWSYRRAG